MTPRTHLRPGAPNTAPCTTPVRAPPPQGRQTAAGRGPSCSAPGWHADQLSGPSSPCHRCRWVAAQVWVRLLSPSDSLKTHFFPPLTEGRRSPLVKGERLKDTNWDVGPQLWGQAAHPSWSPGTPPAGSRALGVGVFPGVGRSQPGRPAGRLPLRPPGRQGRGAARLPTAARECGGRDRRPTGVTRGHRAGSPSSATVPSLLSESPSHPARWTRGQVPAREAPPGELAGTLRKADQGRAPESWLRPLCSSGPLSHRGLYCSHPPREMGRGRCVA